MNHYPTNHPIFLFTERSFEPDSDVEDRSPRSLSIQRGSTLYPYLGMRVLLILLLVVMLALGLLVLLGLVMMLLGMLALLPVLM